MLNKAVLIGRLARDPEMKHTSGGIAWTTVLLQDSAPAMSKLMVI